jgi:hypothetical protein
MTSQEIKNRIRDIPTSKPGRRISVAWWAREIAYQLAATREWEQKRHEEKLKQRDDFLTGDLNDFVPDTPGEYTKTGPFPQFGYPFPTDLADSEPADRDNRTAASLRSCARTILENQMKPTDASDYLNSYADAVLAHEASRQAPVSDHGENLNPHLTRVDSADITCPNCCRPFWVHVSIVGPCNPPKEKSPVYTKTSDQQSADSWRRHAGSLQLRLNTAINLLRHIRDEHPDIEDSWLREEIRRFFAGEPQEEKS